MTTPPPSDRARLRRAAHKAAYDRATIDAILDAQPLALVAAVLDGAPVVIPTLQWRHGDHVYFHGSSASRTLRAAAGNPVCLTVSILEGWKLARSAFHHSLNFRSVMVHGRAERVPAEEKAAALEDMIESLFPGRWQTLRPMNEKELKATAVLRLPLSEASAKVATGPVQDEEEDYDLPIWAGVVPVREVAGEVEADVRNLPDVAMPDHVIPKYLRRR
ncbi:MAG TPA: pyridoxamine 5'-phosphate oxidase family protein [Thermopetrobacter sp.]|nr:pyridoxamine 5'-phosphate oxidase family protein [Thermopetrobacter sp.]